MAVYDRISTRTSTPPLNQSFRTGDWRGYTGDRITIPEPPGQWDYFQGGGGPAPPPNTKFPRRTKWDTPTRNQFGSLMRLNELGTGLPFGGQQQTQQNPYQVLETPRSSDLADRIKKILGASDKQQRKAETAVGKYESALNRAPADAFAKQESDYLSRFYDSRAQQELEGMRQRQGEALRQAGELARGNLRRDLKQSGFQSRGGASSRLDQMAMDRNLAIESNIANRMSAAERGDYDYLNQMRAGALGQRGNIYDRLAGRELLPMQARNQLLQNQVGLLGNIGQQERANTLYHLAETPEYTQSREYQSMMRQQGWQPTRVPGTNYGMDMSQTEPWARFPRRPFAGYGVNPMNNLYGYQYAMPQNNYPNVLQRV